MHKVKDYNYKLKSQAYLIVQVKSRHRISEIRVLTLGKRLYPWSQITSVMYCIILPLPQGVVFKNAIKKHAGFMRALLPKRYMVIRALLYFQVKVNRHKATICILLPIMISLDLKKLPTRPPTLTPRSFKIWESSYVCKGVRGVLVLIWFT